MAYNIDELSERFEYFEGFVQYNFAEQERNIRVLDNNIEEIIKAINDLAIQVSEIMSDFDKRIANIEPKTKGIEKE